MTTINVGRPAHLTTREVAAMVSARLGVEEITDACAVTIASWWQSPGRDGIHFAALSTSGTVDHEGLLSNMHSARRDAMAELDASERKLNTDALDMLGTWVLAKIRETTSGYTPCGCRDCFDLSISSDVTRPELCLLCKDAGCEINDGECCRDDAYGDN